MTNQFSVRVDGIRFASAHFATFRGRCEPLHGHSYQVEAQVEGPLTADAWVIDFHELKALLRQAASEVEHKFMLQCKSPVLGIEELMSSDFSDDDRLLTKGEVAQLCRVDVRTVERWLTAGKLTGQRTPSGRLLFRKRDILTVVARVQTSGPKGEG